MWVRTYDVDVLYVNPAQSMIKKTADEKFSGNLLFRIHFHGRLSQVSEAAVRLWRLKTLKRGAKFCSVRLICGGITSMR